MEFSDTAQLQLSQDLWVVEKLLSVDSFNARLRPITHASIADEITPLTSARLFYFDGPRLVSAVTSVEPVAGGDLALSFLGTTIDVERRNSDRVKFETPVAYRTVRAGKTYSAWHTAVAHNLSAAGMGLWMDTAPPLHGLIDVRICLPELPPDTEALFIGRLPKSSQRGDYALRDPGQDNHGLIAAQPVTDTPRSELPPLRCQAQVRHIRRPKLGAVYVGMRFTAVTPNLYWQLSQLVQALGRSSRGAT